MAYPPYINIFGGGPIWPSNISRISYNLDTINASITLQFPQVATTAYVTAGTIDVITSNAAHTITMPDVTIVSPGYTMWVVNSGSANVDIYKQDGLTLIVTIPPGLVYAIQVADNTTANGIWWIFQLGAGSSTVSAAQLAGPGLVVDPLDVTKLSVEVLSKRINTPGYTIVDTDRATLIVWDGGTATVNIDDIVNLGEGFVCYFTNLSAIGGIVTLTCTGTDTIDDLTSFTVARGTSFEIVAGTVASGEFYTVGAPQFSLTSFSFPNGTIAFPSINFVGDVNSGFSFAFTSISNQSLNFSLHGNLQAAFTILGGVQTAHFLGEVMSHGKTYIFGTDNTKSRLVETTDATFPAEYNLNNVVYNVAGTGFTNLILQSTGLLTYQTSGGANPLVIHANSAQITPGAGLDLQRDNVSYLAWSRIM